MSTSEQFEKSFLVSWDQLHRDARALAWRLDSHSSSEFAWRALVAIARGGMAPAMIIARELDIRTVDTISVRSYDHQRQVDAKILKFPDKEILGEGEGILIVDDLVDTGENAPNRSRPLSQGSLCHRLCEAQGSSACRYLHNRGQPGHVDFLPVGYGPQIRPAFQDGILIPGPVRFGPWIPMIRFANRCADHPTRCGSPADSIGLPEIALQPR